jgi:hypothetical protein
MMQCRACESWGWLLWRVGFLSSHLESKAALACNCGMTIPVVNPRQCPIQKTLQLILMHICNPLVNDHLQQSHVPIERQRGIEIPTGLSIQTIQGIRNLCRSLN